MRRNDRHPPSNAKRVFRCATYTRKSTEEGLEQEFNSLDAQRESGEAYIKSQMHDGWVCLPDRYDDGGYTGGNMDRPALRRLMNDIEAGKVDCVVVYKVDRLSRSLLDFAKMMETFEKHQVAFVSVTQLINTGTSMGRLMLNVLLSFAQFERELISERTRDKIAAARRKGKWSGGHPLLGYDVDPNGSKLIVNAGEASRVLDIFNIYLEHEALIPTVKELDRRGWPNKRWTTRNGNERGGRPFDKGSLYHLLTNVTYVGQIRYKNEIHKGEHAAIVPEDIFQRVQAVLQRNRRNSGALARTRYGALLTGLLHCRPCGCAMVHTYTSKNGTTRYRYYVCSAAQKRGRDNCPSKSLPAAEIERFVVEQIQCVGQDPALVTETLAQTRCQTDAAIERLQVEQAALERELRRHHADLRALASAKTEPNPAHLADVQERIGVAERRASEVRAELAGLRCEHVAESDVVTALVKFDEMWNALSPREQSRLLHLLIERVDYDGAAGAIAVTFHPTGIKSIAGKMEDRQ